MERQSMKAKPNLAKTPRDPFPFILTNMLLAKAFMGHI